MLALKSLSCQPAVAPQVQKADPVAIGVSFEGFTQAEAWGVVSDATEKGGPSFVLAPAERALWHCKYEDGMVTLWHGEDLLAQEPVIDAYEKQMVAAALLVRKR